MKKDFTSEIMYGLRKSLDDIEQKMRSLEKDGEIEVKDGADWYALMEAAINELSRNWRQNRKLLSHPRKYKKQVDYFTNKIFYKQLNDCK